MAKALGRRTALGRETKARSRQPAATTDVAGQSATERALKGIGELILRRQLMPGQQIRQEDLAERLSMSRIPVREALRALEALGFADHVPNQGYFVKALRAENWGQSSLMRRLLETEVLRQIDWPSLSQVKVLTALNAEFSKTVQTRAYPNLTRLNRQFHFGIFGLSKLKLIVQEIERLWLLSEAYRSLNLPSESDVIHQGKQHAKIIEALRARDVDMLITAANEHRQQADHRIYAILQAGEAELEEVAGGYA